MVNTKNWRGLPMHPVDEWDHWSYDIKRYDEIKATFDNVRYVNRAALLAFAEIVADFKASEQAESDAGPYL